MWWVYIISKAVGKKTLRVVEATVRIVAAYASPISQAAAAWLAVFSATRLLKDPGSSAILVILSHIFVVFPVVGMVLRLLAVLPEWICKVIVFYLDYRKSRRNAWDDGWEGRSSGDPGYGSYTGHTDNTGNIGSETGNDNSGNPGGMGGSTWDLANDNDKLHEAMWYFGLDMPYTDSQARERRKTLMKKAHPDAGGSEEDAKKINAYYEVLRKYAV